MSNDQVVSLYAAVFGSLYFAALLSTAFYGIACIQTFFYYVNYEYDPLWIKIFVIVLWALNTVHEALMLSGVYKVIMDGLGSPLSSANASHPEFIILYLLTAVIAIPAQGFFVYRLYIFSKKNIIAPAIWVVMALVILVCSIIYVSKAWDELDGPQVIPTNVGNSKSLKLVTTVFFSVAAGVDTLIAISMTFLLLRERATIGFASTAHILQRLIMFAVNTGTWTATFAVLTLVLLHVSQSNLIYTVFCMPICSVYCITVLANLNARGYLRGNDVVHMELSLTPSTTTSMRVADITASVSSYDGR